jgi:hypothetical protein
MFASLDPNLILLKNRINKTILVTKMNSVDMPIIKLGLKKSGYVLITEAFELKTTSIGLMNTNKLGSSKALDNEFF